MRTSSGERYDISRPALTLLTYLALERKTTKRVDLAELFYPDVDPRRGRSNVSNLLWKLRETLGEAYFERTYQTIALNWAERIWVDAGEYEATLRDLAAKWQANGADGNLVAAATQMLNFYRGPLMQDIFLTDSPALQEWYRLEQEHFRRRFLQWSHRLAQFHLSAGDLEAAATLLTHALRHEPLDESLQMLRLQLAAAQGNWSRIPAIAQQYRRQLDAELDVTPTEEFEALAAQLAAQSTRRPPEELHHQRQSQRFHAPVPLTHLFGREEQIRRIVGRLLSPGERLITLTGMGGSGKTALALTVGARVAQAFRDGVCFVPLATVDTDTPPDGQRTLVIRAVAAALEVENTEAEIEKTVRAFLRNKEMLLILDNYEHLLSTAALLSELLAHAPLVRILATSRERLNLLAEGVEFIDGLALPARGGKLSELERDPAVQLFVTRARQALPDFKLTAENREAICRICHRVEGLPLGLELAAHWVTLFTVDEVADAVERQLNFLVTPHSDLPERHRSMRNLFNHSWSLLDPEEQRTLTAVSIFQHTFDREAMTAVSGCDLATIQSLVSRALVRIHAPGRYTLHPLLKSFAAEQRGTNAAIEESFYVYVLGRLHPDAHGGKQPIYDSRLDSLQGLQTADVAHAWKLAVAHNSHETLARALPHFALFWRALGRQHEGIRLLEGWWSAIVASPTPTSLERLWLGQIHHHIALAYQSIQRHAEALRHGEVALDYLQEVDKGESLGWLLADLGGFYLNTDQSAHAAEHLEGALAIGKQLNAPDVQMEAVWKLAAVYWAQGDYPRADALYRRALSFEPSLDIFDPERAKLFIELFNQAAFRQDWRQAERILQRLEAWCTENTALPELLFQQRHMTILLLTVQERWEEAHQSAQELVAEAALLDDIHIHVAALEGAVWPALNAISPENALNYLQEAKRLCSNAGLAPELIEYELITGVVLFQSGEISEAACSFVSVVKDALAKPGELFSLRRLIAAIFYLAQIARPCLSPDVFQKAVITTATQPQTGFLTRATAQRLAAAEGIAPVDWSHYSQRPVDWSELERLIESILPWVDPRSEPWVDPRSEPSPMLD